MEVNNQVANGQGRLVLAVFLTAGMSLIALFGYMCFTEGTREFWGLSAFWSFLVTCAVAVFVLPVVAVIAFVIKLLQNKGQVPRWINDKSVTAFGVGIIFFGICSGLYRSIPAVRFCDIVDHGEYEVSEVDVIGFNSFLARRWLVSFRVSEHEAEAIAAALELEECSGIDLRESLRKDLFFSSRVPAAVERVPRGRKSRSFTQTEQHGQAEEWVTFVYSDADERAWLYLGYQN